MDAFGLVISFAGISPGYFWDRMDWREYFAIVEAYQNDWEKTRVIVSAFGGELKLPWDGKPKPFAKPKKPLYNRKKALNVAAALAKLHNRKN